MFSLDMWSTAEFIEKALIGIINTSKFTLDRLTRQRIPMRVGCSFQNRQVSRHRVVIRIRKPGFISLTLPLMEIRMHLPHIVKQVPKSYRIALVRKLIFIDFHGIQYQAFIPNHWETDTWFPCDYAGYVRQPDSTMLTCFIEKVKAFYDKT